MRLYASGDGSRVEDSLCDLMEPFTSALSLLIASLETPEKGNTLDFYFQAEGNLYDVTGSQHIIFYSLPKMKIVFTPTQVYPFFLDIKKDCNNRLKLRFNSEESHFHDGPRLCWLSEFYQGLDFDADPYREEAQDYGFEPSSQG